MRKKSLGMLLALVLALSPVFGAVSFADEEECEHENTRTDTSWNEDEMTYTPEDVRCHLVSGPGRLITYCEDCGEVLSSEEITIEDEEESHRWSDGGVCSLCDYVNDCDHEDTGVYYELGEDVEYEPIDDINHRMTGSITEVTECSICWLILDRKEIEEAVSTHEYDEDGVCWLCGHENQCQHLNMEEPYLSYNDVEYESVNDEYHHVTGTGDMGAWCPDCEHWIITEPDVTVDEDQEHYYQNGECIFCEHKNPCKHPDLQGPYTSWHSDDVEYISVDDLHHRITGTGYTYTYCPDCGEWNYDYDSVVIDELEEHSYEDGVCEYCGHENECTHPNLEDPEVVWDYDEVTFTPIDNLYHHITGPGWIQWYCPDCGSYVKGEDTEVDEKEKHWFWHGECYHCGYKVPVDENVARIYGSGRYETSYKAADELKEKLGKDKFDAVILADGRNYPDALAGSYLSCLAGAPILLVNNSHITAVQNYIKENLDAEDGVIYILGGTGAVPDDVKTGMDGYKFKRLAGADRYATNIEILKEAATYDTSYTIVVCTGKDFADSLSAAALERPILLVGKSLTKAQKEYLDGMDEMHSFCIVGGTGAVNQDIEKALKKDYGYTWRIAGKNRYETSVNVARSFFDEPIAGVLAYGKNFPDGLCGGALASAVKGPLILTTTNNTTAAIEYAEETGISFGYVLGGPTLISDEAAKDIFHLPHDAEIIE